MHKKFNLFLPLFTCLLVIFLSNLVFCSEDIRKKDIPVIKLKEKLDSILDDPEYINAFWGLRVERLDGELLYERNSEKKMVPASNMKIYTTAAALDILGEDFQYTTTLEAVGKINSDGVLEGSLVIVGSGDPTLGSTRIDDQTGSYQILSEWVNKVKEAGIKEITGDIVADGRIFTEEYFSGKWEIEDLPFWYAAGSSGVAIEENCFRFTTAPGEKVGDKAIITIDPVTDYVTVINDIITKDKKIRSTADIVWKNPKDNIVYFGGDMPISKKPFVQRGTVWDGNKYAAILLMEFLEREGINVHGNGVNIRELDDLSQVDSTTGTEKKIIATYTSIKLSEIVNIINRTSHNFFADQLLRTLGYHTGHGGEFDGGADAVREWMIDIGVPNADMLRMYDGSGLARLNMVQAIQICSILRYMIKNEKVGEIFYESLPIAGMAGDLKRRMTSEPLKGNIHAKTGYINMSRSLSGYVTDSNNEMLVFSIITNNHNQSMSQVDKTHDKICEVLAKFDDRRPEMTETISFEKIIDGLAFPEGPAWDGKDTLYFSDCYEKTIYKVTSNSVAPFIKGTTEPFSFEKTVGLTVSGDGDIYACESSKGEILKISPDGDCETYASGYNGKKFTKPNDLIFDSKGNLYFTDPDKYTTKNPDGVVYMVKKGTKEVIPVVESLGFPNGIAISPDGKNLYVCESVFQRVSRFDISEDGSISNKKVFVDLPGGDPDGINFDSKGNLWVAHFGGGSIYVISPNGKILSKIDAPGKKPSNIEFGGENLDVLYLTECETKAVYKALVNTPGLPLSKASVK